MSGMNETLTNWKEFINQYIDDDICSIKKAILIYFRDHPFEMNLIDPDELVEDIFPVLDLSKEDLVKLVEFMSYFKITSKVISF